MKKLILPILCISFVSCGMSEQRKLELQNEAEQIHIDSLTTILTDDICTEKAHEIVKKYTNTDFNSCRIEKQFLNDNDFIITCNGAFEYNYNGLEGNKWFSIKYYINAIDLSYELSDFSIKDEMANLVLCEYYPNEDCLLPPKWKLGDEFVIGSIKVKLVNIHGECQQFETSKIMNNTQIMQIIDHFQRDNNYGFVNFYLKGEFDGSNDNYYKRWQKWSEKESIIYDIKTGYTYSVKGTKDSRKFAKI